MDIKLLEINKSTVKSRYPDRDIRKIAISGRKFVRISQQNGGQKCLYKVRLYRPVKDGNSFGYRNSAKLDRFINRKGHKKYFIHAKTV